VKLTERVNSRRLELEELARSDSAVTVAIEQVASDLTESHNSIKGRFPSTDLWPLFTA